MTTEDCPRMALLMQADFDGELDVGATTALSAHLGHCAECQALQSSLTHLSQRLRSEVPRHAAPARLRAAIQAACATQPDGVAIAASAPARMAVQRNWRERLGALARQILPLGASAALAATIAMAVILPREADLTASVVDSHIRALQPGHLMDVVSTDQHTVKPWFDGRLDFAPPVRDLAREGFPLTGGRLDYLSGRPVAALTYRSAQHVIDLYVWPNSSQIDATPGTGERSGYHFVRWTQNDMVFWAVSDLNDGELGQFVALFRAQS